MSTFLTTNNLADILGTSLATTKKWGENGIYPYHTNEQGHKGFYMEELSDIAQIRTMVESHWEEEKEVTPRRDFTSIELFAGAGGLALGMHKAGFRHVLLNEMDNQACQSLRVNHPEWNVYEGDIHYIDFTPLRDKVDFLSGGFPCQAFSYAGKKCGLNDTRGTLFFELARAVKEIRPKVFMGENVKGLLSHDGGKTLNVIRNSIKELGYTLVEPQVLKAILYQVPQKRERLILIAIRNDIAKHVQFHWPDPYKRIMTLRDAFFKGILYSCDVPESDGQAYPEKKREVMKLVPEGGDWRDLPIEIQKSYMGGSFYLGGGKTGMARRLSMDEPSLTLTCAPAQKQTERCHPTETRPLTVREYARIQTFPDEWLFMGNLTDQYKQIGNAVPVNLAYAIGRSLIRLLNDIDIFHPEVSQFAEANKIAKAMLPPQLFPIDMFDLFEHNPGNIVDNSFACAEPLSYYTNPAKNLLVCLVSGVYEDAFNKKTGTLYYTGKTFPSTISTTKLFYFMPYIKGKGIRDLYLIKKARVGSKREIDSKASKNDYRLMFELEFVKQLFKSYKGIDLRIWRTYTNTTLEKIMEL